jgi:hypothetical protein
VGDGMGRDRCVEREVRPTASLGPDVRVLALPPKLTTKIKFSFTTPTIIDIDNIFI